MELVHGDIDNSSCNHNHYIPLNTHIYYLKVCNWKGKKENERRNKEQNRLGDN
jgi:hypothetical protein